jgi:hypothetical protein
MTRSSSRTHRTGWLCHSPVSHAVPR